MIAKVFCPARLMAAPPLSSPSTTAPNGGYLVGWNMRGFTVCIAAMVPYEMERLAKDGGGTASQLEWLEERLGRWQYHGGDDDDWGMSHSDSDDDHASDQGNVSADSDASACSPLSSIPASLDPRENSSGRSRNLCGVRSDNAIWRACKGPPIVLGEYRVRQSRQSRGSSSSLSTLSSLPEHVQRVNEFKQQSAAIWFQMVFPSSTSHRRQHGSSRQHMPFVKAIYCCGIKYNTLSSNTISSSKLFGGSTSGNHLKMDAPRGSGDGSSSRGDGINDTSPSSSSASMNRIRPSVHTLFYSFPTHARTFICNHGLELKIRPFAHKSTAHLLEVDYLVNQINAVPIVEQWIRDHILKHQEDESASPEADAATTSNTNMNGMTQSSQSNVANAPSLLQRIPHYSLHNVIPSGQWSCVFDFLRNHSSTVKVMMAKIEECTVEWPMQYRYLRQCIENSRLQQHQHPMHGHQAVEPEHRLFNFHRETDIDMSVISECFFKTKISLYSRVLQFMLDTLLGIALACILWWTLDRNIIFEATSHVNEFATDRIRQHIAWLMGWPAGLKLNDNLDEMLGNLSLAGITWWSNVLQLLSPLYFLVFNMMVMTCFLGGGISCFFALFSDVVNVVNAHLLLFYTLSFKMYSLILHITISLWRLFRGKKKNVLRQNRIDECNYSTEQLVLGTLFFTLLVFLYPTVAVYYFSFAFIYFVATNLQVLLLQCVILVVRRFPTFMVLLWMLGRIPLGGFFFEQMPHDKVRSPYKHSVTNHMYFSLKQKSPSLSVLLQPLHEELHLLMTTYLSVKGLLQTITT